MGFSLIFGALSLVITEKVEDFKAKRLLEILFLVLSFGVIVVGYIESESAILMILTLFIAGIFILAFALSYLIPKIKGDLRKT